MNPKKIFIVALVAAAILAGCSGEAQADYRTYVIRPAINNNAILDDEALPAECRDESIMKVLCARGEYEPASFLVETDKPLEQVMVKVAPLTGSAGVLPPETVDVRIARKLYRVGGAWSHETFPWVLVHDPGMWNIIDQTPKWVLDMPGESYAGVPIDEYRSGNSKMNQLTRELVDTKELQPADIDGRRQFWLTVHVPKNAASGTYRAQVTISAKNASETKLTLEVTIPKFDLLPAKFEYSISHPALLPEEGLTHRETYNPLTEEQYLAEIRNMVAHGCSNPNIYQGPTRKADGTMNYSTFERILELRREAGIPQGEPLYIMTHAGEPVARPLSAQERQQAVREVRELVAWVRQRGYPDVYIAAGMEFRGDQLRAERESFEAIHEGGGKIWATCFEDFFGIVGDLMDRPALDDPGAQIVDRYQQWQFTSRDFLLHRQRMVTWDPKLLLMPNIQKIIRGVHKNGFKIFMHFDPQGGMPVPQLHRRNRGLTFWKTGIDGTMPWAYTHTSSGPVHFTPGEDNSVPFNANSFVLRSLDGVLDTLSWEAYREGHDDARYLATLQDAIAKAKAGGKHASLVARTERWLGDLTVNADLDAWRWEMARRTEELLR